MVNKTLTGFDATILIDGVIVGRSQNFSCNVAQGNEYVYEQGTRKPVEIKEKKFECTGEISRYHIDASLVQKALGGRSFTEVLPYCTIQGYLENPETGEVKPITVQFVKFETHDLTVPLEGAIEEKLNYKALNVVYS